MEEKSIMYYSSSHKILLVGEGDFSFALCMAKEFGSATNIVATSLDSRESLRLKYGSALSNLSELESLGCTIVHEVDVHVMKQHPLLQCKYFDRIVFNFPHAGFTFREHNITQIELHKYLVSGFLNNARYMLASEGQIHITHKIAHPFSEWKIKELGLCAGLLFNGEEAFNLSSYPGYINKRGAGHSCDDSFPVGLSSTFKFSRGFYL